MKKEIISAILLGFITVFTAQAQTEFIRYGWEIWGVYSLVPKNATVKEATKDAFEISNDQYTVRVECQSKDGVSSGQYAKELLTGATKAGMTKARTDVKSTTTANKVHVMYISGLDNDGNSILFALISGGTKGIYLEYKLVFHSSSWATALKMLYSVEME